MPVSVALLPQSFVGASYAVAMRFTIPASTRFVKPGSALGSNTTVGIPRNTAASITGPAAYPPTPRTAANLCRRRIAKESSIAGKSFATFRASLIPPMPLRPAERIVSSVYPFSGTRRASIPRCVPANTTCLSSPRDNHSWAIASAGKTCPPVPPPAISSFKFCCSAFFTPLIRLLADVQEHACCQQHDHQARPAIADERQGNPLGRHHPQHYAEVNERLAYDHHSDAQSRESPKFVLGLEGRAHSAPAIRRKQCQNQRSANETQLLA